MEIMDKGLPVPKWVLINRPKIPQMPQNLSAQIVCPSPKVCNFDEKRLHWASVVRAVHHCIGSIVSIGLIQIDSSMYYKTHKVRNTI